MASSREDAVQFFKKANAKNPFNRPDLERNVALFRKIASEEGLDEDEIDEVILFLTNAKNTSQICIELLYCLVPKSKISNLSLERILLWFFTEVGNQRISNELSKKCVQWLEGVTYYELGDISVVESYLYSFIFLMNEPHLESSVCRLLALICKPEDARRWVVQQILNTTFNGPSKPHINRLLSLLKSYCANVVPERVSLANFHHKPTPFDEVLKKARDRNLVNGRESSSSSNSCIQWNTLNIYNKKSRKLSRLIPSADTMSSEKKHVKKKSSVCEFKTMTSLGIHLLEIECPAETLSLLANVAGHHILAFSDFVLKTRFFHKLYHTLCRVFILENEPYSIKEKFYFLKSIRELQEYAQESIPVVTIFLFHFIPIWDGECSREEILGLLEWLEIRNHEDLEKYIFPSLRQIYISSNVYSKCLIIETMAKLMRNLFIMDKKELSCFRSDFQNCNIVKCIEAIHNFVTGLISNGLIWNKEKNSRNILNSALDFYETAQAVEQAGDLPLIMVMPSALVYTCLFSGSRICIARVCSLLVRLQISSVERLFLLGVFEDFTSEVQKLNIYLLDFYRCLFSKINFREEEESFIFQRDIFCDKFWKLKEIFGDVMDKIFGIEYNSSFWDPKARGSREVVLCHLAEDYPSIIDLKQITEERLLQVY